MAFGFDIGSKELSRKLTNELDEGGIFIFNQNKKNEIDSLKMSGRATTVLKRIDVICYQIELAYNLGISHCDNVSQNPGFESCLGIW